MLKILNHEVKRGEKFIADYYITGCDGKKTKLTYYVISGIDDGPVACITSGIHGTEYPGIAANFKIYQDIKTTDVKGTIIGVPICNMESFVNKTPFVNPLDKKNLNETFPGNALGTITEKMCSILINEIVRKADFHIDMHSGDITEYLYPFTFYHKNKLEQENTEKAREMAKVYGLDFIVFTEKTDTEESDDGNFYAAVSELGIPSIQPEIGGVGLLQEKTKMLHYKGVRNVLAYKGMIDDTLEKNKKQWELSKFYRLKSEFDGMFHCFVVPGQFVKKGELLARITDYHADKIHIDFFAEDDAVVLWIMSAFSTCIGENIMALGLV